MKLKLDQLSLLPSNEDVEFYREHGWYISPKIVPDELIDKALQASERYFAGERDRLLPITGGYTDWRPGDGSGVRNCEYVSLQNNELRQLVQYPLIGAIAARLAGSLSVRLWDDQLICKPPDLHNLANVVGWHTDRAYWMTCTSDNLLTAWVPFQDSDAELAPLMVIDGSHKWRGTTVVRTFRDWDLKRLERAFTPPGVTSRKVPMLLKKGQVSYHHCLTVHGSDVNRGSRQRVSLAIHIQDEANRYRVYRNSRGVPWELINDRLCRKLADGTPDYADPEVFLPMWQGEFATKSAI